MSTEELRLTEDMIPCGTKVKNTYDNHIWIFNNVTVDGVTTLKWQDMGSDSICTASNDGVKGLVSGSNDKLRGYVDMQGVISINGLEEELKQIVESINLTLQNVEKYETETNKRLDLLEKRLVELENR